MAKGYCEDCGDLRDLNADKLCAECRPKEEPPEPRSKKPLVTFGELLMASPGGEWSLRCQECSLTFEDQFHDLSSLQEEMCEGLIDEGWAVVEVSHYQQKILICPSCYDKFAASGSIEE